MQQRMAVVRLLESGKQQAVKMYLISSTFYNIEVHQNPTIESVTFITAYPKQRALPMKSFWLRVVSLKTCQLSVFATTRPHNSNCVRIDKESTVTSYRRNETNYASSIVVVGEKKGVCGMPCSAVSVGGRHGQYHHHQEMVKRQCNTALSDGNTALKRHRWQHHHHLPENFVHKCHHLHCDQPLPKCHHHRHPLHQHRGAPHRCG